MGNAQQISVALKQSGSGVQACSPDEQGRALSVNNLTVTLSIKKVFPDSFGGNEIGGLNDVDDV